MISVGLLGYGLAGRVFHAPFIATTPGLRLTAIATLNLAARARNDYPTARICGAQDVIGAADIDLVVVATPNESHAELTLQALDAGKSVIVDKPMATSVADAERMAERAAQHNLTLSVFHNRRWDDDFLTLRRLFTTGKLGEWTGYESRFDRFRPVVPDRWRERPAPGSGIWWDLGPHLVDQTLQIFGRPEAVTADLARQRPGAQVPDYAHVTLHYGRRRAILHASCLDPHPGSRFRLQGTQGAFSSEGLDPQEAFLNSDRSQPPAQRYGELTIIEDELIQTHREPLAFGDYGEFYRRIRESLTSGAQAPVTPRAAVEVIAILEAADNSAQHQVTITL
jgi:predicted dehydrogenase